MSAKSALLMICLLGSGLSIDPPKANGQVTAFDTTGESPDNQPDLADTSRASVDTAIGDTAAVTDTIAGRDTTARSDTTDAGDTTSSRDTTAASDTATTTDTSRAQDTAAAPATTAGPAASAEPVDSILSSACSGAATVARGLLVIVFAPEATVGDRTAAAESVKGKLLRPASSSEPGAYYLRVSSGGGEFGLRAAADELIQLPQVRQVGSRACPSTPLLQDKPQ